MKNTTPWGQGHWLGSPMVNPIKGPCAFKIHVSLYQIHLYQIHLYQSKQAKHVRNTGLGTVRNIHQHNLSLCPQGA